MKSLLSLLLLINLIFALESKTKEFWEQKIKDLNVSFGYYDNNISIIVANKTDKIISIFEYTDNNLTKVFSSSVITGLLEDKQKEGDLKTPVGIYKIDERFVPKWDFYGPIAFATNYPNLYDKYHEKTGSGIWIHGYPMSGKREDINKTRGCLALKNDMLKIFDSSLDSPINSILIIYEKEINYTKKEDIITILTNLELWKNAWINNETKEYFKFYDKDFKDYKGNNLTKFKKKKSRIFKKKEEKIILFSDYKIIPYPNKKAFFKVSFKEIYKSKSHKFSGEKILYLKVQNNSIKILIEK